MYPGKFSFTDLDTVIDRVHALFDTWLTTPEPTSESHLDVVYRTKLAVHEWLANLVQHADFDGRYPDISLEFHPNGERIHCAIEDNSMGFDLDAQLTSRQEILDAFPDRGMGLLMIKSCTEDLSYQQIADKRHRLEFAVSVNHDPWLNIPFQ